MPLLLLGFLLHCTAHQAACKAKRYFFDTVSKK